jgi:hypothetical protein
MHHNPLSYINAGTGHAIKSLVNDILSIAGVK